MEGCRPVPVVRRPGRTGPHTRALAFWTGLLALLAVLPEGTAPRSPTERLAPLKLVTESQAPVPGTGCSVFPANNIWNEGVTKLRVHRKSSMWLKSMKAYSSRIHPAFGPHPYGMPSKVVSNLHPKVNVGFEYRSESDRGPYPFGLDIPIEQTEDRHALMINKDTCMLYELYRAFWNNGSPKAGSGAIYNLKSNKLRPNGWTSADAAGLPIFAGLIRYDEVMSGIIPHAIRFTTPRTDCKHVWPARHHGKSCARSYPPMGARFRLKSTYGLSRFSYPVRVILRAMQRYGLIVADQGPNWYFWGTTDQRWTNSILGQLKRVPASQFQAVDTYRCMIDINSGASDC
jgi:hypothetical protein